MKIQPRTPTQRAQTYNTCAYRHLTITLHPLLLADILLDFHALGVFFHFQRFPAANCRHPDRAIVEVIVRAEFAKDDHPLHVCVLQGTTNQLDQMRLAFYRSRSSHEY